METPLAPADTAPPAPAPTDAVQQKIAELCEALLARPDFSDLRRKVGAFMNDESAKFQYQMLSERSAMLQQKQNAGLSITPEEAGQFEALREGVMKSTVAMEFLDAQQEIGKLQDELLGYVQKTIELGRVPTKEDFDSCCSSSCGCH
ncbi:MAG: YlbF family regulator [Verrucomicrobia bacterium]|nr:YlbF family regulator [Verrucomicrobiota bacterium]